MDLPSVSLVPTQQERVLFRWKMSLPNFIWNTASLEGNTFTLPEVITLLDGITIGGKPLADAQQILSLQQACTTLYSLVEHNQFAMNKKISDLLHTSIAQYEAIESGHFRGEGVVIGGGSVNTSTGILIPGTSTDKLLTYHDELLAIINHVDPIPAALLYFIVAARHQFYFDGNKRTARLIASGLLLQHGIDAINIPYIRRYEFNQALDELFITNNGTRLAAFLYSCLERTAHVD